MRFDPSQTLFDIDSYKMGCGASKKKELAVDPKANGGEGKPPVVKKAFSVELEKDKKSDLPKSEAISKQPDSIAANPPAAASQPVQDSITLPNQLEAHPATYQPLKPISGFREQTIAQDVQNLPPPKPAPSLSALPALSGPDSKKPAPAPSPRKETITAGKLPRLAYVDSPLIC